MLSSNPACCSWPNNFLLKLAVERLQACSKAQLNAEKHAMKYHCLQYICSSISCSNHKPSCDCSLLCFHTSTVEQYLHLTSAGKQLYLSFRGSGRCSPRTTLSASDGVLLIVCMTGLGWSLRGWADILCNLWRTAAAGLGRKSVNPKISSDAAADAGLGPSPRSRLFNRANTSSVLLRPSIHSVLTS